MEIDETRHNHERRTLKVFVEGVVLSPKYNGKLLNGFEKRVIQGHIQ